MTEDEAKTKMCPPRCGWDSTETYDNELQANCVASDCMMWVWDTHEYYQEKKLKGLTGHCGLIKDSK